jgi:hypothetical protein
MFRRVVKLGNWVSLSFSFCRDRVFRAGSAQCCDAWVLWSLPNPGQTYARALVESIGFLTADCRPAPALASGLGPVHLLERRLEMVLHSRHSRGLRAFATSVLVCLGLGILPLSASAQEAADQAQTVSKLAVEPPTVLPSPDAAHPAPKTPASLTPSVTTPPPTADSQSVTTTSVADTGAADAISPIEARLNRLEKMMERVLSELQSQSVATNAPTQAIGGPSYPTQRSDSNLDSGAGLTLTGRAVSLSVLKKQRIDLLHEWKRWERQVQHDEKSFQDRLEEIDEEIAELPSARSTKTPTDEDSKRNAR